MTGTSKAILRWALCGGVAVVFLVLLSSSTSFFRTVYGGDSAIFRVIGSAMADGQELYADVWDHKGPALFFIQWLGQVIREGRAGIFVLQAIALTVSLALIASMALRRVSLLGSAGVVGLVLAVLSFTFEAGNLSEEFSLPFIVFVLWGAMRALDREAELRGSRGMLLFAAMGVAFAFVFFTRANNAIPIAGIFAGLLVQMLLRRSPVVKRFLVAVLGFAATAGLFIGWFALRGTLEEMLDAAFWFNLRYVEGASIRPKAPAYLGTIAFSAVLAGVAVVAQLCRRGVRQSVWALAAGLGLASVYAVLSPTTSYAHYLTLIVPLVAFGAIAFLDALSAPWRSVLAVLTVLASSLILVIQVPQAMRYAQALHAAEVQYERQLDDVLSAVPEGGVVDVFPWSLPATYYLMTDTQPTYKYFITQPWWGSIDPQVPADTVAHIVEANPRWVLIPAGGAGYDGLQEVLDRDYAPVRHNERFQLFELR